MVGVGSLLRAASSGSEGAPPAGSALPAVPAATGTMRAALVAAARLVSVHWRTWLRTAVVLQVLAGLIAGPVIVVLLRFALRAAGVTALTEASIGQVVRHPLALLLLLVLAGVATTAVLVQHAAFVLLGRDLVEGRVPSVRELAGEGLAVARRLGRAELALVGLYVFVIAPLGGFGLGASLTRGIELPPFIAAEVQKTPLLGTLWLLAFAALLIVNLRLVLVPTLILTTPAGPREAFAASWRLSRRRTVRFAALAFAIWFAGAVLTGGLVLVTVTATSVTESLWPGAAAVVAGLALTAAQALIIVGAGLTVAFVTVVLLALSRPPGTVLPQSVKERGRPSGSPVLIGGLVLVLATAALNTAALLSTGSGRVTAVMAHRGVTYGAVENTLQSLEAAAALGADYVELDVVQAGDEGLVVVHDTNLRRIAGINRNVFDMTTVELSSTIVRQGPHTGTIPTFDDFAARAAALDVSLLVELKQHGRERGDPIGDVVAVLERHNLVDTALVQVFDRATVAELEGRFPQVTTGWVVAFSRGRLDPGRADFVTMEQTSYSPAVLRQAHQAGVRVLLWTVTDPVRMRVFMRDGVDGIITGEPALALEQREAVLAETAVADRLADTLRALVDW